MATIKGKDLMVFRTEGATKKAFAGATSHSLSVSRALLDTKSKDSGKWPGGEPGDIEWSITTECLFTEDNFAELTEALISGELLDLVFDLKAEADGEVPVGGWTPKGGGWTGKAYITAVDANAPNGDKASYSATFTGTGELSKVGGA
ncbi:phage major tail protein, TP901-1 family [Parabacteroides sp. Marseille-P3160]|uniref:phage major tail protein, TP901-1 family n=1 Tax=Parabacteroides sp. Marseille-P3160 TaxID=1917887 RepID=UPI0009BB7317|nr:phage major tail protein, TP901-1 family [Parabacteroides sp. Marseille-P3160]